MSHSMVKYHLDGLRMELASVLRRGNSKPLIDFHIVYNVWKDRWETEAGEYVNIAQLCDTLGLEYDAIAEWMDVKVDEFCESFGCERPATRRHSDGLESAEECTGLPLTEVQEVSHDDLATP